MLISVDVCRSASVGKHRVVLLVEHGAVLGLVVYLASAVRSQGHVMALRFRNLFCGALVAFYLGAVDGVAQGRDGLGTATEPQTRRVIEAIDAVFTACANVEQVYLPDCVGRAMQAGAGKISRNPAYWEGFVALTRISRTSDALVRDNIDPNVSNIRAAGFRLRPVSPDSLPQLRAFLSDSFARADDDLSRVLPGELRFFDPIRSTLAERPWP